MDKLHIFNTCLTVYNIAILTEEQLQDEDAKKAHPDIMTLEVLLPVALHKVMREYAWSFLDVRLELGEDLGPRDGYRHSYNLPPDCFRVTRADGLYRVVGSVLLTNGRPIAYGQKTELPDSGVPADFDDLVAYALAIFAGPKLSPGDAKVQLASTFYQTLVTGMALNDSQNAMRETAEVADGCGSYV